MCWVSDMKKKRRVSKSAKRRLVVLVPITFIAVLYFLTSLAYYTYKIYHLKVEEKKLTEELHSLQVEEDDLKTDIEKLQNPDYLARYARENYHYSKKGELVIQRQNEETEEKKEEKENNNNQSIMIICILSLLIVLIYIFKRKPKKR